jgi:hypothetical protein
MFQSLADVQSSAERWSTALGGLLGIFGTVALVTGPSDIAKVASGTLRVTIVTLIIVAGIFAGVALYLAALVQLRPSPKSDNWNGTAYQIYVISKAQRGAKYLNLSRGFGVVAAVFVFAVGAVTLIQAGLK